ncbi:MFS transporter [Teichococcus vastitatis]|uniref:MFS transporter n=1 Tax=Teichococcus vastitatis TaxID=2307076 RepID=A0ABS9W893_9PROT|nr:MFS transporter [Pseudoroseomonas vastitatis]MCI0755504.1 MFS transporter [Pseudoroseomonas vastitatis]
MSSVQMDPPGTTLGSRGLGLSLLVIATAQLMLVLDDTIANIAPPSIQRELAVSATTLPWIINAYILVFGGLLLFGGRVGDLFGRRRVFRAGLGVFIFASLFGGLGLNAEMLIGARALQGLGAALTAPNALALIATNFPVGKSRNSAMAVYGAMSALGITIGVLLGGVLTGTLGWRWVFFINIPIGLVVLAGSRVLAEGERNTGKLDTPGAITGTGAVVALTYGITHAAEHGWGNAVTLGSFGTALVLTLLFLVLQMRGTSPMLPLGLFQDRNRWGSYATMLFVGAGLMGTFYLLALYLQQVLGFDPLWAGVASLPFSAGIILGAGISSKLVERLAPRLVAGPGLLLGALGMLWLSTLAVDSTYAAHVMPALFLISFGLGMAAVVTTLTAVHGVAEDQAGVASALVNMAQQIGAALGLAVFTTLAVSATNRQMPDAPGALLEGIARGEAAVISSAARALTYGYTMAFLVGAGLLLLAAIIAVVAVTTRRTQGTAVPGDGA